MTRFLKACAGILTIAAFGAAGLFGTEFLLSSSSEASQPRSDGPRTTRVGVTQPETRPVEDAVTAVGTIMPVREVELRAASAGRVAEVAARAGSTVAEGDLILQLDADSERAALQSAEASLSEARQSFERVEALAASNTAAEARLEEARAAFNRAQSDVTRAEAALADRRIAAPFAGTLGLIDLDPGAWITPETPVARLSDLSVVQVRVALPERYYDRVRPGQTITLSVPAYPDATFEGVVTVRDSAISAESRSFDIRAEIDNPDQRLTGGMFARTRLVFGTDDGLTLPDDAIISEGETTFVYAVEDGQATRREVALGGSLGERTVIRDGLSAGDRIVVTGWDSLRDGAPVEIAEDANDEALQ